MQTETFRRTAQATSETTPYAPSFVDRLMRVIEQLPGPAWLTYLTLFLLESIFTHAVAWAAGMMPPFKIEPILLLFPLWLWLPLAMMSHLNAISLEALSDFSPLLDMDEEQFKRLKYEFTTMPARPVVISSVFWVIVYIALNLLAFALFYATFQPGPVLGLIVLLEGLLTFALGSALYYHSVRQLRLVDRTVKMVKQFNLFRLDPVYAFSRVTAQTGIAWIILLSLSVLCFPLQMTNAPVLILYSVQLILVLAVFVLPLSSVHKRLVIEKRSLLAGVERRFESTLARLHRSIDGDALDEVAELNDALAGLNAERDILARISTWPWRTATLTGFLSVVILPIVLLVVQLALEAWLSR